jgi:hypothetical protein
MKAGIAGHGKIMRLLADAGARQDLRSTSSKGTAVSLAAKFGHAQAAIEAGLAVLGDARSLKRSPDALLRADFAETLNCANPIRAALVLACACGFSSEMFETRKHRLLARQAKYIASACHVSAALTVGQLGSRTGLGYAPNFLTILLLFGLPPPPPPLPPCLRMGCLFARFSASPVARSHGVRSSAWLAAASSS